MDFAERVLPILLERLDDPHAGAWLDAEIEHHGRDARRLVGPGVETWASEQPEDHRQLLALFGV